MGGAEGALQSASRRQDPWAIPGYRLRHCPYQVGQLLWVRESWHPALYGSVPAVCYRDGTEFLLVNDEAVRCYDLAVKGFHWRNPLFMPRWASRITLEIVEVRVQRLQDISEEDAIAEGMPKSDGNPGEMGPTTYVVEPVHEYMHAWDSLNAKKGYPWASNPWVWCLSFKRVQP